MVAIFAAAICFNPTDPNRPGKERQGLAISLVKVHIKVVADFLKKNVQSAKSAKIKTNFFKRNYGVKMTSDLV